MEITLSHAFTCFHVIWTTWNDILNSTTWWFLVLSSALKELFVLKCWIMALWDWRTGWLSSQSGELGMRLKNRFRTICMSVICCNNNVSVYKVIYTQRLFISGSYPGIRWETDILVRLLVHHRTYLIIRSALLTLWAMSEKQRKLTLNGKANFFYNVVCRYASFQKK